MHLLKLELIVLIALTACLPRPVYAVEMEDGPAYLTDSHGASGVVHAFLELSEVTSEYGTRACPDRVNFERINIALDYGQTGVVLAGPGRRRQVP